MGESAADFVVETNVGTRTCVLVGHTPADLDGDGHDQVAAARDDCDGVDG